MSLLVGDVSNAANVCVLASVVLAVAMVAWSEALRRSAIWLVLHATREGDAFTARSFYRWAWVMARVAPALLIGAVALQQARLEKTKVIAIDYGVAEVRMISTTSDEARNAGHDKQIAYLDRQSLTTGIADPIDESEDEPVPERGTGTTRYTTAKGTVVSFTDSTSPGPDDPLSIGRPETRRHWRPIRRSTGRDGDRVGGVGSVPLSEPRSLKVW